MLPWLALPAAQWHKGVPPVTAAAGTAPAAARYSRERSHGQACAARTRAGTAAAAGGHVQRGRRRRRRRGVLRQGCRPRPRLPASGRCDAAAARLHAVHHHRRWGGLHVAAGSARAQPFGGGLQGLIGPRVAGRLYSAWAGPSPPAPARGHSRSASAARCFARMMRSQGGQPLAAALAWPVLAGVQAAANLRQCQCHWHPLIMAE